MRASRRYLVALLLVGLYAPLVRAQAALTGVNLAGADFGEHALPGVYGQHYTYPTSAEIDYFTQLGMNVFRLPFRWERLQPVAYEAFDAAELARLDGFVGEATDAGAQVILDPHNYARYYGDLVGADISTDAFADFWRRLATHYAADADVIFGLMNEPHTMATELWLSNANAAIDAIREAGAANLILVPGNAWTGAHSWTQSWYGTPNATVMQNIVDPIDHYAIDLHQYFDQDFSGTSPNCTSATVGSEKLVQVTNWLREQKLQGFLGEFGVAANTTCLAALDDLLDYIDAHTDAWLGWTYWAAGPWWGNYMFSIEPGADGSDQPQTAVLREHLAGTSVRVENRDLPEHFHLGQGFPNPFQISTRIPYQLAHAAPVRIEVFDVLGRRMTTLVDTVVPAGYHETMFEAGGLPGGVYLLRFQTGNATAVTLLTLQK